LCAQPHKLHTAHTHTPFCRPAITTLITHISEHLSSPSGNPNLALTFQPLVNMALNLQLRVGGVGCGCECLEQRLQYCINGSAAGELGKFTN
jgi:hypothetical protein